MLKNASKHIKDYINVIMGRISINFTNKIELFPLIVAVFC